VPPWEKENHLQKLLFMGYVSSLEGRYNYNLQSTIDLTNELTTDMLPTLRSL